MTRCALALYFAAIVSVQGFHMQHTFNPNPAVRRGAAWSASEAALEGSSCLEMPLLLQWFWYGIGYHHIHHLDTRVPGYNLRRCHEEAAPSLWDQCGVVRFHLLDVRGMLGSMRLTTYDEASGLYVSHSELRRLLSLPPRRLASPASETWARQGRRRTGDRDTGVADDSFGFHIGIIPSQKAPLTDFAAAAHASAAPCAGSAPSVLAAPAGSAAAESAPLLPRLDPAECASARASAGVVGQ